MFISTRLNARTLRCSHFTPALSASSLKDSKFDSNSFFMARSVRIAVVGDVHDDWNLLEDTKALKLLQPDLVLFTGDFGNENVELVRSIADVEFAKAIILGNHDAWGTQNFSERKDAVQRQLEYLGDEHVGYRRLEFPTLKLSIVGGRPFSCGGNQLFRKRLLSARYGIRDMERSADRIYKAALGSPEDHSLILLAHNGPTGLGSNENDICGRDWVFGGGDHGDPDLAWAISRLKERTKLSIPLVVFGHMHKELAHGGLRKMIVVGDDNTVYLNGAVVPRVKRSHNVQAADCSASTYNNSESEATSRAFTVVDISNGRLKRVAETWVSVIGDKITIEEEHTLFSSEDGNRVGL